MMTCQCVEGFLCELCLKRLKKIAGEIAVVDFAICLRSIVDSPLLGEHAGPVALGLASALLSEMEAQIVRRT